MEKRVRFMSAIAGGMMTLGAASAHAVAIVPTNLDGLALGSQIAPTIQDDFVNVAQSDVGDITNEVWRSGDLYRYIHIVTPGIPFYSEVNTAFDVLGFTGVAGYSFTDAAAAGLTFLIDEDPDGTLDWEVVNGGDWNSGESIALFFESTLPPGYGDYNAINGTVGTATSYAPIREEVPAPASLLLFGTALLGFMGMRRSKIR